MGKRDRKKRERGSAAKRRAEQHDAGFERTAIAIPDGVKTFSLDGKAKRIDIINYRVGEGNPWADKGELYYERTFWLHWGIGPNKDGYVCPAKTANKKCPICEYINKLDRTDKDQDALFSQLIPRQRQLFNVIDLGEDESEVLIWEISFHNFGKKLDARIRAADEDDGYEEFAEYEKGLVLKIGTEQKSIGQTKFFEVDSIDFKKRNEDYDEETMIETTHCLDDLLLILPYDELLAVFEQTVEGEDVNEKKKETNTEKKSLKKGKTKTASDPDNEPEWGDEPNEPDSSKKEADDEGWGNEPNEPDEPEWGSEPDEPDEPEWGSEPDEPDEPDEPEKPECPWKKGQKVLIKHDGKVKAAKIKAVDEAEEDCVVTLRGGEAVVVDWKNMKETT